MVEASTAKLTSMHFHAWEKGLKTGMCLGIPWDLGGCLADFWEMWVNVGKICQGFVFFLSRRMLCWGWFRWIYFNKRQKKVQFGKMMNISGSIGSLNKRTCMFVAVWGMFDDQTFIQGRVPPSSTSNGDSGHRQIGGHSKPWNRASLEIPLCWVSLYKELQWFYGWVMMVIESEWKDEWIHLPAFLWEATRVFKTGSHLASTRPVLLNCLATFSHISCGPSYKLVCQPLWLFIGTINIHKPYSSHSVDTLFCWCLFFLAQAKRSPDMFTDQRPCFAAAAPVMWRNHRGWSMHASTMAKIIRTSGRTQSMFGQCWYKYYIIYIYNYMTDMYNIYTYIYIYKW